MHEHGHGTWGNLDRGQVVKLDQKVLLARWGCKERMLMTRTGVVGSHSLWPRCVRILQLLIPPGFVGYFHAERMGRKKFGLRT